MLHLKLVSHQVSFICRGIDSGTFFMSQQLCGSSCSCSVLYGWNLSLVLAYGTKKITRMYAVGKPNFLMSVNGKVLFRTQALPSFIKRFFSIERERAIFKCYGIVCVFPVTVEALSCVRVVHAAV
ncbi:uncharacterized protein ACO6RY_01212 [Pungitius sinensis]